MDRLAKMLYHLDVARERGLEIGPLDKPVVKRTDGREIYYCDYAPRHILRQKSANDPTVNVDLIPDIDFVAPRITAETFGGIKFDYIIASHVIEHVPDMIGWIHALLASLNGTGRIVLAVPDRRYTFDYTRPLSTTGEFLQAFFEKRASPSFSQIYNGFSQAAKVDTLAAWESPPSIAALERYYTPEVSLSLAKHSFESGEYQDCHCWVFECEMFLGLIRELQSIGILKAKVLKHYAPVHGSNEFHVLLGHE
ncbi:class I SAM-dependent methyltransferase [Paraburkholderia caribensis]|uniref:class I SAM-dependent methyltransferase n=1 Tax=Paraburkholderia caribensis TaxID=75105 RepID=UPI001CAE41AD|nr:methyltransferase domain-containing protein [Paraburkholderia caribensis]CAG9256302.1 hypothetical protein PCAR4_40278 [Paraburkholderia caribensis]